MNSRILCIDDESEIRQDIAEELKDAGYETIEASDGAEGLETIVRSKPDLVICDITMPAMNGHAVLERLREDHPEFADLPFIFLSALADRKHIVEGKRLGADDYLTKPVDYELMLATVESRLNQVKRMEARKQEQLVKLYKAGMGAVSIMSHDGAGGMTPSGRASRNPADGPDRDRLKGLANSASGKLVGGRVQVIGLEQVREAAGDRWLVLSEKINEITESIIYRHLSPEDVLQRSDTGDFLICFSSVSDVDARQKARAISLEIKQKLLGSDLIEAEARAACEVHSDAHEIGLSAEDIDQAADPLGMILDRLDRASSLARKAEHQVMAQLVESCQIAQIPISTAKGGEVPVAKAEFDESSMEFVEKLRRSRPDSEDLAAQFDNLRLAKSAELICQMLPDTNRLMIIDLQYTTIDSRRLRDRYLQLCNSLTKPTINHLAFNVRGIPDDKMPAQIVAAVGVVRSYCRFLVVEAMGTSLGSLDPIGLHSKMVASDFMGNRGQFRKNPELLKKLVRQVHEKGCKFFIYNLPTTDDVECARACEANFIARRP